MRPYSRFRTDFHDLHGEVIPAGVGPFTAAALLITLGVWCFALAVAVLALGTYFLIFVAAALTPLFGT